MASWEPAMMTTAAKKMPRKIAAVSHTAGGDQIGRQRADVQGRAAVAAYHQTGDQAPLMRAEPGESRRRGRGITDPHADAAEDAEPDDQAGVALHQTGDDTAHRQKEAAGDGAHLGARSYPESGRRESSIRQR